MFHFLGCSGLIELFGILEVIVLLVKPVVGIVPLEELVWHVLLVLFVYGVVVVSRCIYCVTVLSFLILSLSWRLCGCLCMLHAVQVRKDG